jgi:hypothetical protein
MSEITSLASMTFGMGIMGLSIYFDIWVPKGPGTILNISIVSLIVTVLLLTALHLNEGN